LLDGVWEETASWREREETGSPSHNQQHSLDMVQYLLRLLLLMAAHLGG
jgi:hypothetical protein